MRLEIEPTSGPADETPSVKVISCPPESEVTITVAATDAKDHRWESQNVFRTDVTGTADTSRDAPVWGSYASTDPAGPIWSMRFASEDVAPSMFAVPWDQLQFTFTAEAGGETASVVAQACRVRRAEVESAGPGVSRQSLEEGVLDQLGYQPFAVHRHPRQGFTTERPRGLLRWASLGPRLPDHAARGDGHDGPYAQALDLRKRGERALAPHRGAQNPNTVPIHGRMRRELVDAGGEGLERHLAQRLRQPLKPHVPYDHRCVPA